MVGWFIEAAYLARMAPSAMVNYAKDPDLYHEMAEGQLPGWGWVDPNNDAKAAEKLIDLTLDNHRNQAAQRGIDWDTNFDELLDIESRMLELAKIRQERKQLEETDSNAATK